MEDHLWRKAAPAEDRRRDREVVPFPALCSVHGERGQGRGRTGLAHFAILSDGTKIQSPRFLRRAGKKLKREQRRLSRKAKGSNNRTKARMDWRGPWAGRSEGLAYVFDGGVLSGARLAGMRLQAEELGRMEFVAVDRVRERLTERLAARVVACARAREQEVTVYLEDGVPV